MQVGHQKLGQDLIERVCNHIVTIDPLDQLHGAVGEQDLGGWSFSSQNGRQGPQCRLRQNHPGFEIVILHPVLFALIPTLPEGLTLDQGRIYHSPDTMLICNGCTVTGEILLLL